MRRRYKRRGKLTKLLYVLVPLFLISLCDHYRNHPGIFYTHLGLLVLTVACIIAVRHFMRKRRNRAARPRLAMAQYIKSRIGQNSPLRRLRNSLTAKGQQKALEKIAKKALRRKKRRS